MELVESDVYYKEMDEDAFEVVTKFANLGELVKEKEYEVEGGKRDVCKAILDLMEDSREQGIEQGIELLIFKCLEKGRTCEEISEFSDIPLEDVKKAYEKFLNRQE